MTTLAFVKGKKLIIASLGTSNCRYSSDAQGHMNKPMSDLSTPGFKL